MHQNKTKFAFPLLNRKGWLNISTPFRCQPHKRHKHTQTILRQQPTNYHLCKSIDNDVIQRKIFTLSKLLVIFYIQPTNCFRLFDHSVRLVLKGLSYGIKFDNITKNLRETPLLYFGKRQKFNMIPFSGLDLNSKLGTFPPKRLLEEVLHCDS